MKIGIFSLTYKCRGHSKEYIDNLVSNLQSLIDFEIFCFEQKIDSAGVGVLDYKSEQLMSSYRKIIRRFFCSIVMFYRNYKKMKSCDKIFFTDYEYISLLIILFMCRNQEKIVWIHSATLDRNKFYYLYKKLFFSIVKHIGVSKFIVNGEHTSSILSGLVRDEIHTIQYPSEIHLNQVNKLAAKKQLGFGNRKVFSLLGMIRSDKNYEFAIKAFSQSNANNQEDTLLYIAGAPSGVKGAQIDRWLKQYNVKNCHTDYSYLTEEILNYSFSATDVILIPYGENSSSQSGPLSLCRNYLIPAVVRRGGELGFYVTKMNVGLACEDIQDFILAINTYKDTIPSETIQALKNAKDLYSWAVAAKRYQKVFGLI